MIWDLWEDVHELYLDVTEPSRRDEALDLWIGVANGHLLVGALLSSVLTGWFDVAGVILRIILTAALYWFAKERGDLRRGGNLRDGLVDTSFVAVGSLYGGPAWFPALGLAMAFLGALIRKRKREAA